MQQYHAPEKTGAWRPQQQHGKSNNICDMKLLSNKKNEAVNLKI